MLVFLRKSNFTGDWDLISRIWLLRFDSFAKISNYVNMKFYLEDKFGRYSLLLTWSSKKWKFGIKNRENRLCLSELGAGGRGQSHYIFMNQLTWCQPGSIDYAHQFATYSSGFLNLPTALNETGNFQAGNPRQTFFNSR